MSDTILTLLVWCALAHYRVTPINRVLPIAQDSPEPKFPCPPPVKEVSMPRPSHRHRPRKSSSNKTRPDAIILSVDPEAAIRPARTGERGPGKRCVVEVIDVASTLIQRGNSVTIRWRAAYNGVEDNRLANMNAKVAAENTANVVRRRLLRNASLALTSRSIADKGTSNMTRWIEDHVKSGQPYRPPRGERMRQELSCK